MRLAVATVAASLVLGACTELPDRVGPVGECVVITATDYAQSRDRGTAWRTVNLAGGGYRSQAAGQNMQRCWPRVQDMNTPDRRCVQTDDLVVEMRTDDTLRYYRVPARTTYMLYGEAGESRCQIVMQED